MDVAKLPTPRADGPREALRILLGARLEITTARTGQVNRLRALLVTGEARRLDGLARRRQRPTDTLEQAVRRAEARRLAIAIRCADKAMAASERQLRALVEQLVPGLQNRRGIGPVSAAQAIVSFSHQG